MKNTILLPLFLGLLLAGCSRTATDSKRLSSNEEPAANKPAYDDSASPAKQDADAQSQVAAAPASGSDVSKDATVDMSKNAPDSTQVAANSTPAAAMPSDSSPASVSPVSNSSAATDLANIGDDVRPSLSDRLTEWKLTPDDIKGELEASGRVVRSKTIGAGEPTGSMDNSILVSLINSKLQRDADTSALKIGVQVDNGVVTLDGSAQSLDQIGKAIALSLDTGGVKQAISQIKLETNP